MTNNKRCDIFSSQKLSSQSWGMRWHYHTEEKSCLDMYKCSLTMRLVNRRFSFNNLAIALMLSSMANRHWATTMFIIFYRFFVIAVSLNRCTF